MKKTPTLLPLTLLAVTLLSVAGAQGLDPDQVINPPTGGLQNFIEFTQLIPSMNDLLKSVMTILAALDVAGVADTLARLVAGVIALLTFGIAWFNYGLGKRFSFMGIDGSLTNMILAGLTVLFIATGVPRIMGEAGWAVWRVTYTAVEERIHPSVDRIIQKQTSLLAKSVWDYAATGLSAGFAPVATAGRYFSGDLDVNRQGAAGAPYREAAKERVAEAKAANGKYGAIWQIGSLLIASMFMAYIGVIFGSGLFVIFTATFMPVAFAFLPLNSSLLWKSVGGMVSSILVAGVAPGLMLANVIIVFSGPIDYLTRMMTNQSTAAATNADALQTMMSACLTEAKTDSGLAGAVTGAIDKIGSALNPLDDLANNMCIVNATGVQTMYTLGQASLFMIVGLVVAGMLFLGLSALGMMIFREFKGIVDGIFAAGGGLGTGGNGAGQRFASQAMNRLTGAAMTAGGIASGNTALASAGMRTVASGNNALGNGVSAWKENRDKGERRNQQNEQQKLGTQREEEREAKSEAKYQERTAESRKYSEDLHASRQAAQQEARQGSQDKGEGSRTDPRSAYSGGEAASQPDGGAQNANPNDDDGDDTPPPTGGGNGGGGSGGGQGGAGGSSGGGSAAGTSGGSSGAASAAEGSAGAATAATGGGQPGEQNTSTTGPNNVNLDAGSGKPASQGREMMAQGSGPSAASRQGGSTTGPNNVNLDTQASGTGGPALSHDEVMSRWGSEDTPGQTGRGTPTGSQGGVQPSARPVSAAEIENRWGNGTAPQEVDTNGPLLPGGTVPTGGDRPGVTEVDTNGPLPGGSQPVVIGEVDTNGPLPGGSQPVVAQPVTGPGGQVQNVAVRSTYQPDGSVQREATPTDQGLSHDEIMSRWGDEEEDQQRQP